MKNEFAVYTDMVANLMEMIGEMKPEGMDVMYVTTTFSPACGKIEHNISLYGGIEKLAKKLGGAVVTEEQSGNYRVKEFRYKNLIFDETHSI